MRCIAGLYLMLSLCSLYAANNNTNACLTSAEAAEAPAPEEPKPPTPPPPKGNLFLKVKTLFKNLFHCFFLSFALCLLQH